MDSPVNAEIVSIEKSSTIEAACSILANGGVVVLPTDTVYGVGSRVDKPAAVARLYVVKGRPEDRAIPVLVSSVQSVGELARNVPAPAWRLMERFWPGALTLVIPAASWVPREVTGGTGEVGLRMPDYPPSLSLIDRAGGAMAVTSANRSGEIEARNANEASATLGKRVDLILDGGQSPGGKPSTVVRVTGEGVVKLLREGAISFHEILNCAVESSSP